MLNHLLNRLRLNRPKPLTWDTITDRTTKDNSRLTEQENAVFNSRKCPDCGSALLKGPEGCGSVNMYCSNKDCGSKYNDMGPFGGERINDSKGAMTLVEEHRP